MKKCITILIIISIFAIRYNLFYINNINAAINNIMPTDSRIKTFIYSPNEVFQVKFMLNYQSIIELAKDEDLELISFGDPIPWSLKTLNKRLFIKALDPDVRTNMTIITNKRTYLLEISSTESQEDGDDSVAYILRFFYPDPNIDKSNTIKKIQTDQQGIKLNDNIDKITKKATEIATLDNIKSNNIFASNNKINFKYSYAGNGKTVMPIRVFDNSNQTFFKFNSNKIIPSINLLNDNGQERPLIVRTNGEYLVVDIVSENFTIRYNDEVICIFNEQNQAILARK